MSTVSSACEVVRSGAVLEEFTTTPESQRIMDDLVIASEARAKVAAEKNIGDAEVDVEVHGGVATITGTVASVEEADGIKLIARHTPGVVEVISRLRVRVHW